MVGLCQGEVTLGSGYTDASGSVTINVTEVPTSDDVTLTVTAHNLYPLQEWFLQEDPGLRVSSGGITDRLCAWMLIHQLQDPLQSVYGSFMQAMQPQSLRYDRPSGGDPG